MSEKYYPNPEYDEKQLKKNEEFKKIIASDEDVKWEQDPKSYFTIMPYYDKGKIMVRVYSANHEKKYLIEGETPKQIYYKIIKMGLITKMEHAAYLGKELQKAYTALKHRILYVQDDPLDFSKKIEPKKE